MSQRVSLPARSCRGHTLWVRPILEAKQDGAVNSHKSFREIADPQEQGLRQPAKAHLRGSVVALLVTKRGLVMPKDEERSGPGGRDFRLASQVERESN